MPSARRAWPPSGLAWATTENRLCRRPNQLLGTGKPTHRDPDIRFIHPPGSVWMPDLTPKPLIQNGRIVLDPTPDGDVVHQQAAFRHHLFQVAVAERVAQIPPNAQNDDHVLEVSPSEQRRAVLVHASRYQICLLPTGFCNRSFGGLVERIIEPVKFAGRLGNCCTRPNEL